ncbi:MAG: MBL fold metallo-hydrolase [Gemmatimonadaceae bacterium]
MPKTGETITIVNVGYRSTNFWVVSAGTSRLLIDLGWPGTMRQFKQQFARMDVPLNQIKYALATHYHMDHAGLAQDLKLLGIPLLVVDVQTEWIPRMKDYMKPTDHFTDITLHDNVVISTQESRARLATVGIAGEILHTPGHSPDSVSLLLDDGSVFTGDLTHPMLMVEEEAERTSASWQLLRDHGALMVYPGHGGPRRLQ